MLELIPVIWFIGFSFTVGILVSPDNFDEQSLLFRAFIFVSSLVLWPYYLGIWVGLAVQSQ